MKVGIELLSPIPGRCGAVSNLWRNNLSLFPSVDEDITYVVFVTPILFNYYKKHIEMKRNLLFHICDVNGRSSLNRIYFQEKEIPKLLREYECDLFFTTTPTPTFYSNLPIEIFKITGIQFYSRPKEFGLLRTFYHHFSTRQKALRSKFVVVNSNYVKREILKKIKIPGEKVRVIYESLDHSIFNQNLSVDICKQEIKNRWGIDSKYFLYISDIRPYKNPLSLIQAFENLNSMLRDYKLIMIGQDVNGYKNIVQQYISKKDLAHRIILFDYMEPFDFKYLMRAAEIFIYPSSLETFGTIPIEAMACGVPVIAGNKTAIPEICADGALLVDGRNPLEIADAIRKILNEHYFRKKLIERGLKRANYFSWEKNAHETVNLFKEVILTKELLADE